MRGKVEQIYLKYFDAAKMRGKVGTLIRDKMNRLHVLHYYRLKEHHESWKVKVWKERQIFFHFPDQKIDSKYLELNFFSLWLHFFLDFFLSSFLIFFLSFLSDRTSPITRISDPNIALPKLPGRNLTAWNVLYGCPGKESQFHKITVQTIVFRGDFRK